MRNVARLTSRRKGQRQRGRPASWPRQHDPRRATLAALVRSQAAARRVSLGADHLQHHLERLDRRAQQETLGLSRRLIPWGHLVRDTPAGRQRIAEALVALEQVQAAG